MKKFLKKWLWKTEGQEEIYTPKDVYVDFKLTFRSLEVGTLSLKDGNWIFQYADEFKNQDHIKPLPDFPNVNKIYTSNELYPFFIQRIPGLGQPKVKETLKEEHIDKHNEVALLKRFGRFTIANPFELQVV